MIPPIDLVFDSLLLSIVKKPRHYWLAIVNKNTFSGDFSSQKVNQQSGHFQNKIGQNQTKGQERQPSI